jgi:4-diphosphocytidyl-2-C-methyl-D-erythritol kinase
LITFPNAKINLGLFITDKRSDGYHNIESLFYPINITDVLEAGSFEEKSPLLQISGITIEGNTDANLVSKAVQTIAHYLTETGQNDQLKSLNLIRFNLHKIIPTGAGLGGGSADGTFALKMIDELLSLNLETTTLEKMALKLGSDCPFFVQNTPALVKGRGEIIEKFDLDLSGYQLILIHPGIHISTQEAYSEIQPRSSSINWKSIQKETIFEWSKALSNDFENTVFKRYPKIKELKASLYLQGAVYAQMSGSGSAVYGIFKNETKLESLQEELKNYPYSTFSCSL